MKLFLIRHTKVNVPTGCCYGQTDVALADDYLSDIECVLSQLQQKSFDRIYSSPLNRCAVLAQAIAQNIDDIQYDSRLMEMNFGLWEGRNWNDIEKTSEAKAWFEDYINIKCPEGESFTDVKNRVQSFIQELKEEKALKNVAIVCHGGTIKTFHSILRKVSPTESFQVPVNYGQMIEMEIEYLSEKKQNKYPF